MKTPAIVDVVRAVLSHVSSQRRRQFIPVLGLMLAGALAELVSIGAVLPFLAVIADPERVLSAGRVQPLLGTVGINTSTEIVVAAASAFALAAVVAALVRLLLVYFSQQFVYGVAKELSVAVYSRTLHQPYEFHTGLNSSETIAAINKAQLVTNQLLLPLMTVATASVIATFILAGLVFIDPITAVTSGFGFGVIYLLVMRATRTVMRRNGVVIASAQSRRVQAVGEGLGGIRDVLLDRSQAIFIARFNEIESRLRSAQATSGFIAQLPRYVVEGLGVVLIAVLALALSTREGGLLAALPVLGALALGAQRLLPLLQQIYAGWASTLTSGRMLTDIVQILQLLDAPQFQLGTSEGLLPFARSVTLEGVGYSYPNSNRPALRHVSLVIPKGSRVGVSGKTGSGKSTLMDVVLGLLSPHTGRVLVDDIELSDANRSAWQAQIAHVPQAIYLADASVAENIAFGVPRELIDLSRVTKAAEQAELADVIAKLPEGYYTFVGERGIRLSGGQRQRVGIARALYKKASVLVFDEATSALDVETESAVMDAIGRLDRDLTVLVIAHRLSTLEQCDLLFEMTDGQLRGVPSQQTPNRLQL